MITDENWLDNKDIVCDSCGGALGWVFHSPFASSAVFYCTHCPARVEVSSYDPIAAALCDTVKVAGHVDFPAFYALVEPRLARCTCGGTFKVDAPQRCLHCASVLRQAEIGRDVWWAEGDNRPLGRFLREDDLWQPPTGGEQA